MKVVLEIADLFDECRVVTIPLPAFDYQVVFKPGRLFFLFERCAGKLNRLLAMVEDAGRRMALEVLPGAIVGGIDGFLRLCEHLGSDTLGLNFDTGHAWACKRESLSDPGQARTADFRHPPVRQLRLRKPLPAAGGRVDRLAAANCRPQGLRLQRALGHRDRLPAEFGRGRIWGGPVRFIEALV